MMVTISEATKTVSSTVNFSNDRTLVLEVVSQGPVLEILEHEVETDVVLEGRVQTNDFLRADAT